MEKNKPANIKQQKAISKSMYQKRKIDQFVKWSFEIKNKVYWLELVDLQNQLGIKVE